MVESQSGAVQSALSDVSSCLDGLSDLFALLICAFEKPSVASQTNKDGKSIALKASLTVAALEQTGASISQECDKRMCLHGAVFLYRSSFAKCVSAYFQTASSVCPPCSIS